MKKEKKLIVNGVPVELSEEMVKKIDTFFAGLAKELGVDVDEPNEVKAPDCLNYYIVNLAKRLNWHPNKMLGFLNKMADISPVLPFSLMLKEIAVELDKKYASHIKKSKEIWAVSTLDGSIGRINKEDIATYNNFAAFRTKEDAEFALSVLSEQYKDIFGGK